MNHTISDQITQRVIQELVEIASHVPMITRMWVFGSRLKGTASEGSDLDIAIEVEWVPGMMLGSGEDPFSLWCATLPHFESRMKEVSPWPLDLQNYVDEQETPSIASYIHENSVLIYRRNA